MMNFNEALAFMLSHEGGLVDNPYDHGGLTNFGISIRFLKSCGSKYDFNGDGDFERVIRNLTQAQVKQIYYAEFWLKLRYNDLNNQHVCNYLFDCAINHGSAEAVKLMQRAVWSVNQQYEAIIDDGILGDKTIAAVRKAGVGLIYPFMSERAGLMRLISKLRGDEFLKGWLKRAYTS